MVVVVVVVVELPCVFIFVSNALMTARRGSSAHQSAADLFGRDLAVVLRHVEQRSVNIGLDVAHLGDDANAFDALAPPVAWLDSVARAGSPVSLSTKTKASD